MSDEKWIVRQEDINKLKKRLHNFVNLVVDESFAEVKHKERCKKYKLELRLGDRVYVSEKDLKILEYPKDTVYEGKLSGYTKDMRCYPPYLARVTLDSGEKKSIGVGWLKKVEGGE